MKEKKVSEAINFRRAVRVYDSNKKIDKKIVKKCIEQAILAPSSDNLQLWEFYHITSPKNLSKFHMHVLINQLPKHHSKLSLLLLEGNYGDHELK